MLIFHCTKDACDALGVLQQKKHPNTTSSVVNLAEQHAWHWYVHAVRINRKRLFVIMDADARFALLAAGVRKGDQEGFVDAFTERLMC